MHAMYDELLSNLAILVLSGFVGFAVISKVPNTLHTPLMSGTNAIHGIVILGGLLVIGLAGNDAFNKVILVIAIASTSSRSRCSSRACAGSQGPRPRCAATASRLSAWRSP